MPIYTDQLGKALNLPATPKRIISLVPSQTELLYDLGLDDEVVGITKFCIHPDAWFRTKSLIGGTKTITADRIFSLQPDLIIANKEENVKEQVEALASQFPVWTSDINNLEDALDMIEGIGNIAGKQEKAFEIINSIRNEFGSLQSAATPSVCYLIWKNPMMTIGSDTFIHDMLQLAGFRNLFADRKRYPVVTEDELREAAPQLLLLSSEPYPFGPKHISEFERMLPQTKILLVDGEMFSWYGSRLLKAPRYFSGLHRQIAANR